MHEVEVGDNLRSGLVGFPYADAVRDADKIGVYKVQGVIAMLLIVSDNKLGLGDSLCVKQDPSGCTGGSSGNTRRATGIVLRCSETETAPPRLAWSL